MARYLHKVAGLDDDMAQKVVASLQAAGVVDANDIVDLDVLPSVLISAARVSKSSLAPGRARVQDLSGMERRHQILR